MTKQEEVTPSGEQPKFTPGPWAITTSGFFEGVCIRAEGNRWVAQVWSQHEGVELPREANARLIAAAPALYEALRLHMQWIGPPPIDRESFDSLREDAWRKGQAALALVDAPQETK